MPILTERPREKFLTKIRLVADAILVGGGVFFTLTWIYFIYCYGWTGQRQFTSWIGALLYYVIPAVLATLLFASLRLNPVSQIILAICCLTLGGVVYGVEVFLHLSDFTLSIPQKPLSDIRDRHEVIADLRTQGIAAVPLVWKTASNASVMPVGSISNKLTIVCNQNGQYHTYISDERGFRNPQGIWQLDHIDIAAVGNSFTLSTCVPSERNFVGLIRRRYPATLNLGMVGEGPLHILAILREYARFLKPKLVLWFYSEADTFTELQDEKQSHILMRYLEDDFTQSLLTRQYDIDQALTDDIDRQTSLDISRQARTQENGGKVVDQLLEIIKLTVLRQKLGMVYGTATQELEALSEVELSQLEADLNFLRDILSKAKVRVNDWGGTLYFVYLPCWQRYAKKPEIGVKARMRVLAVVTNLGIPLIDTYPAFQNHGDPLSLFPFPGPGHYNEEGHRVVAETVLNVISHQPPYGSNPRPSSDLVAEVN